MIKSIWTVGNNGHPGVVYNDGYFDKSPTGAGNWNDCKHGKGIYKSIHAVFVEDVQL